MSPIFVILLIVAAVSAGTTRRPIEPIRDCGPNAVWSRCYTGFQVSCENFNKPIPTSFTKKCRRGCVCVEGYIKRTLDSVECILPHECPPQ